jgi:hypothetical protein
MKMMTNMDMLTISFNFFNEQKATSEAAEHPLAGQPHPKMINHHLSFAH